MCYDKGYKARKDYNYAKRYSHDPAEIEHYREQLERITPYHYVSGFSHPLAPVITDECPGDIQAFQWGLIPFWSKDTASAVKLSNQTLNARGETIFEKPAFRASAKFRRCLIVCVDGFFEHHHIAKKKIPFFIRLKNDEPMTLAGLWDRWEDRTSGVVRYTYSVVTTSANPLMEKIHNNPNAEGPRMPVILPRELERDWLRQINDPIDKEAVNGLIQPYPLEEIEAWPVKQLKGKEGVGNNEAAKERIEYPELLNFAV
jgi:putative SOS response-associated peptidase YedK